MPGRGDIEKAVRTQDDYGGNSVTWEAVEQGVAIRIMPGGSSVENLDTVTMAKLGSRVGYQATVEARVTVDSTMRLRQKTPVAQLFDILQVQNDGTSYVTALRMLVAETNDA